MSRVKLTPEQMERKLADMLNAAHRYNLKSATSAPFFPTVVMPGAVPYSCCAVGAAALISCPLEVAVVEPYQCAAEQILGPAGLGDNCDRVNRIVSPEGRQANSAMFHGNDEWPAEYINDSEGVYSDMWELGYMFREAMVAPPVLTDAQPGPWPITGCGG